jgi:hypothetical protein
VDWKNKTELLNACNAALIEDFREFVESAELEAMDPERRKEFILQFVDSQRSEYASSALHAKVK